MSQEFFNRTVAEYNKETPMLKKFLHTTSLLAVTSSAAFWAVAAQAAPGGGIQKTSYAPTAQAASTNAALTETSQLGSPANSGTLVFSAPPRESAAEGNATYGPIAQYLSQALGKPVVYKHSDNWLTYQTEMQKGGYDIVFDGPHFTGWRINRTQHTPLVKFPGEHLFVVVVKKDDTRVAELKQLVGRPVCGMASPNLGTLTLLNQFDNPARQPVVLNTNGWDNIYKGLISGRCIGAVLPISNLQKYDKAGSYTRVIYHGTAMPNQAFSAGLRVSPQDQVKIKQALLSSQADSATAQLRQIYAIDQALVPATKAEYVALGGMLKDIWGYQ
jgi:ABC-type phosphate/phosphonate transport system substrate-binding protein